MSLFRVGVDSYSLGPLGLDPFRMLDWADRNGAQGVHFSELHLREGQRLDEAFLKDVGQRATELGLYLEWGGGQHIPFDTTTWQSRDLLPINRAAAQQARTVGARIVRSCSGGLMRWTNTAPPTEALLRATAAALRESRPMLADLNVVLAIEVHFEFTTFELRRLFEMCEAEPGGCFGVCLDTMNLLTMLEDPVLGTERILPWVVAVHAKDGALRPAEDGYVSFTTPIGAGLVDFERILSRLATLRRPVNLSVEDHGGSFNIPAFDSTFLSRFPDLTADELARLTRLACQGQKRMEAGHIAPLDRGDWPQHCETRMRQNLVRMKELAAGIDQRPGAAK